MECAFLFFFLLFIDGRAPLVRERGDCWLVFCSVAGLS